MSEDDGGMDGEREKASRDLMRIIDAPRWQDPMTMTPKQDEKSIFDAAAEARRELAEERRRSAAREKQEEGSP